MINIITAVCLLILALHMCHIEYDFTKEHKQIWLSNWAYSLTHLGVALVSLCINLLG